MSAALCQEMVTSVCTVKLLGVNDLTLQVEVGRVEYGARRHA